MYNPFLTTMAADSVKEIPNLQVVLIGVGTVFAGLICIVILCKIIRLICVKSNTTNEKTETVAAAPVAAAHTKPIENRQQIIAAVSAAVAEELGTDVSAIRILSFKKL